jgi:hypothetical protein
VKQKRNMKEIGLAFTVVMKLLKMGNYLFKGFHIFMDKFFTNIPLPDNQYKCGTFLTDTIRTNRKYFSKALLEEFNIGQKKFFRRGSILAAAYRENISERSSITSNNTFIDR